MKIFLTILASVLITTASFGFVKNATKKASKKVFSKNTTYHIGLLNSAITMPTKILNGTPHLGVEVGFSAPLKKDAKKQRFNIGADAGYFYQKGLQSVTYLKPNIAYNIAITKKINIQPRISAGAMLTNNLNNEFKANADGVYQKTSPLNLQAFGSIGVQPNVNVYNSKHFTYDAYLRYEFGMQGPFSAISAVLPLTMFHLGVNIKNDK
jgi:hypothetical protein